jgi:hypothetical protein
MNSRNDLNARNDLARADRELDRAGDHTEAAAHHAAEAMEAGASGVLERTREAADRVGRKAADAARTAGNAARTAGNVAGRVARAEPDVEMERKVDGATEGALHAVGGALRAAAPTVGRGAEVVVGATGSLLSTISGPLGFLVGKIAGRVGGWWDSASQAIAELPEHEQEACRVHFEAYTVRPGGLTFEEALPSYALGYVAARNPTYRGRGFDEIEPDLRHGFGSEPDRDFDSLRDFTRFGYERGATDRGGLSGL